VGNPVYFSTLIVIDGFNFAPTSIVFAADANPTIPIAHMSAINKTSFFILLSLLPVAGAGVDTQLSI
jgi:hypothetical protein